MISPDLLAGVTILVVDDQKANRLLLERLMGDQAGATVHSISDPRRTVDECHRISPDLLLLDLHMPQMDGIEVISEIRDRYQGETFMPIVVLTADTTSGAKERALSAGADDFLSKPLDFTEVLLRVSNLIATRGRFSELQARNRKVQSILDRQSADEEADELLLQQRVALIGDAFGPDALRMVFQPISDLDDGHVVGFEALARFEITPQRPPDVWFSEAASIGEGTSLELHAIRKALNRLPDIAADQFLSVNISPTTATSPELTAALSGAPRERVVLELTEHLAVESYSKLMGHLGEFRSTGLRVAVDDAGTGFAGLQHLLLVRPEIIKLDKFLITGIQQDSVRRALVTGLLSFAEDMGAKLLAEGIETAEEFEALRSIGVPWGQGYYMAQPGPLPGLEP